MKRRHQGERGNLEEADGNLPKVPIATKGGGHR